MFENGLFYIDYREKKKVVLQLPVLSVDRDDEGVLSILKVKVLKASYRVGRRVVISASVVLKKTKFVTV